MPDVARNITQIRTPEQEYPQIEPWLRQKNEPANWYMRFRRYLDLGPGRSLRKALASEPNQKATHSNKKLSDISIPSSWSRSAKVWRWKERAEAFDLSQQERYSREIQGIASNSYYASKAARIMELNNLAQMIKKNIKTDMEYKDFLAFIARLQSILHDIDELTEKMGKTFEVLADASAHKQYVEDIVKQFSKAAEATDNPKQALADLVKRLDR